MKITLYTITDCQYSQQEKAYLLSKNLTFEEKNLETNREYLTEMLAISNNFAGTPVTKIEKDDGQIVVLKGFTQDEFDKALGFATVSPAAQAEVQPVAAPTVTPPPVQAEPIVAAPIIPPVVEAAQPPVAVIPPTPVMPVVQPIVEAPAAAPQLSPSPLEELQTTMDQPIPVESPSVAIAPPVPVEQTVQPVMTAPVMPTMEAQAPIMPPQAEPVMPTVQPTMPAMPQDQALNDILSSLQAKVEDPNQNAAQAPANPQPTV